MLETLQATSTATATATATVAIQTTNIMLLTKELYSLQPATTTIKYIYKTPYCIPIKNAKICSYKLFEERSKR